MAESVTVGKRPREEDSEPLSNGDTEIEMPLKKAKMDEVQNLVKKDNQVNGDSKSECEESSKDADYENSNSNSDPEENGKTFELDNNIDKMENGDSMSTSEKLDKCDSNGDTKSEKETEINSINNKTNETDGAAPGNNKTEASNEEENKSKSNYDNIDQNNEIPAKGSNDLGLPQDFSMKSKTVKAVSVSVNGDSDKENVDADGPMDLSAPMDLSVGSKPKKAASDPDIIMLSDDSSDEVSLAVAKRLEDMTESEIEERKKLIRKRQNELRNEEAKLVLLKKIRQSQSVPASSESQQSAPAKMIPRGPAPPPLTRGGVPMDRDRDRDRKPNVPPQLHRAHQQPAQARSTTQPPPLVMAPQRQQNMHSSGSTATNYLQQSHRPVQQPTPPVDTQTPAQRQAAAKLALRKQLEKTLLQIPPPKPPPPEMNFVPSLASNEFIYLIGLEEAVKFITDTDAKAKGQMADVKYIFNPFTCVQCGSDFTPVWKRDKPGSKNVICEQCVTTNQKKALKQEHTNRLKSAFVKALQQEQEIEQRMQQQQKSAAAAASSTVQHHATSAPSTTSATFTSTAHQNLVPAHAHSSRPSSSQGSHINIPAYNPRLTFPYQVGYKPQDNAHRQYLLDMIPRSNTVLWKS
ncbi:unnamed protein product [Owenia fusiformis]|uniref:Uncharacterized protein n=1 Tax=Owenia fusiformis TaxID=6347 RepID=A0A8J1TXR1_OWEFU|nr:unnamed protein product [Owenia fusiformis]